MVRSPGPHAGGAAGDPGDAGGGGIGPATAALCLLLVLGAALAAYRPILGLGHLGWDTYPLIAASRIQAPGDLAGTFREELMDGRYPHGRFYRPVTNLVFAADHALWGLDPRGYHRTDLAILLAATAAVFLLGWRLLGATWAPLVAALVFALHPLHYESIPISSRRADSLSLLFVVATLWVHARIDARPAARTLAMGGLFAVLAVGAKETGIVAVPVVFGLHWIRAHGVSGRERLARAGRLSAVAAGSVAAFLGLRTLVLGGLGGHADPGAGAAFWPWEGLIRAPAYARALLMPQPVAAGSDLGRLFVPLVGGSLAVVCLLLTLPASRRGSRVERPAAAPVLALLTWWFVCLVGVSALAGRLTPWYASPFLPPYALLLGALAAAAARAGRSRRWAFACATGVVVSVLLTSHLRFSGLGWRYDAWDRVSVLEREFLDRFRREVAEASPGDQVFVRDMPIGIYTALDRIGVRNAVGLSSYGVQAWADLTLPDLPVVVTLSTGDRPSPRRPGEIVVDVVPDGGLWE